MMESMITCRTLTDGGQTAVDVAREVAAFLDEARQSLELAVYDLELSGESETIVLGALRAARDRGVEVRLVYNVNHPNPIPVPPPPQCVPEDVAALPVETLAVSGIPDLMHHKFAVRDRTAVLTGSTNWTDDSWTRQENLMVSVESAELGEAYGLAFDELWSRPVMEAGRVEPRPVEVGNTVVRPWFCPGFGDALSHRVAKAIGRAKRRVRICSPVISAGPVLGTLAQVGGRGPRGRRRLRGRDAARVRAPAMDGDEGVRLEDPAARDDSRASAVLGQELDAVGARQPPRLHAREGDRRRRRRLLRVVQSLAVR